MDMLLEAVLDRLNDIKQSIGTMIHRLESEYETINWPTVLDNFALVSSHVSIYCIHSFTLDLRFDDFVVPQLTGLSTILSLEIGTPPYNLTVLPLHLTPERDEALLQLTEVRIQVFSHDYIHD